MRKLQILIWVVLSAALAQSQQLTIQPEGGKQTVLAKPDIESLTHVSVSAHYSDKPTTFEGVALKSVLEKAGVEFGHSMQGKRLASCLLVEAADGYRAVIALPEIDPDFTDKQVVLAFLQDGKPLDAKAGPYRVVIPGRTENGSLGAAGHNLEDRGRAVGVSPSESLPRLL